jgi:hypothetical protein
MKVRAYLRDVLPDSVRAYVRPLKGRAVRACVRFRVKHPGERLKPSFLIVGAAKAGTTSLFLYLSGHPQIAQPLRKEINFFTSRQKRSLSWYLAHFPRVDSVSPGVITGEASPAYLADHASPERVASVLPDAKIIALLRNPVARAISHYHHDIKNNVREARNFADYLVVEGAELQPQLTSRLVSELGHATRPIDPSPKELWPPIYIRQGLYADQLSNWLKHFSRDRMLILKGEDLFANPRDVYARTLEFLGLEFFDPGPMKAHNVGRYGNVDPVIVRYLTEIYSEPNRRLYELLGFDLGWDGFA